MLHKIVFRQIFVKEQLNIYAILK